MSIGRVLATPLIWLIRVYQRVISPMRPPTCRYYPSCSAYAVTALERYGVLRGSWMAARRLGRCHPWTPGGSTTCRCATLTPAGRSPAPPDRAASATTRRTGILRATPRTRPPDHVTTVTSPRRPRPAQP